MRDAYLVGDKVCLRALERKDLSGPMRQWVNDPEVTRYTLMGFVPNTAEALEREFDALTLPGNLTQSSTHVSDIVFALMDRAANRHIGIVGLFGITWIFRVAELRAVIGEPRFWGGGRIHDAYRLILDYAFSRLNLRRIVAGVREDNAGAAIALKKVGFECEGCLREHYERDGRYYDVLPFGLLKDDYYVQMSGS